MLWMSQGSSFDNLLQVCLFVFHMPQNANVYENYCETEKEVQMLQVPFAFSELNTSFGVMSFIAS